MDPNETLATLRNLSRETMLGNSVDTALAGYLAMDLAEAFQALDSWLSNGGFLPKVWENYR